MALTSSLLHEYIGCSVEGFGVCCLLPDNEERNGIKRVWLRDTDGCQGNAGVARCGLDQRVPGFNPARGLSTPRAESMLVSDLVQ